MSDFQLSGDVGPRIKVMDVRDSFGPAAPGQSTRIKVVSFTIDDGTPQYIEVPLTQGWVERARSEIIQHAADIIDLLGTRFGPE